MSLTRAVALGMPIILNNWSELSETEGIRFPYILTLIFVKAAHCGLYQMKQHKQPETVPVTSIFWLRCQRTAANISHTSTLVNLVTSKSLLLENVRHLKFFKNITRTYPCLTELRNCSFAGSSKDLKGPSSTEKPLDQNFRTTCFWWIKEEVSFSMLQKCCAKCYCKYTIKVQAADYSIFPKF